MANNPGVSEVVDKDGVIADIEAKRFDGTRTFTLQGDVSGTQTWNGDSSTAMTLNVSIGAKKVTTDKINDKAVGTGQLDDISYLCLIGGYRYLLGSYFFISFEWRGWSDGRTTRRFISR